MLLHIHTVPKDPSRVKTKRKQNQKKIKQESWVWSLVWEDPLEKRMAIRSSILAWRIPWTEESLMGYSPFIDCAKTFDGVDHNKLWRTHKVMRIPDHLTYLQRNPYVGQEATVRTGRGTMDWLKIEKGVPQGCILSPCLFNLHAEHIMWNAGLDELQAGIKVARRNISNLRYADEQL